MTDISKEPHGDCVCDACLEDRRIQRERDAYRAQPAPADVVERLRQWASQHSNVTPLDGTDRHSPTFGDLRALLSAIGVSDEVERLRSENERLRSALNAIRQGPLSSVAFRKAAMHISRQALTLSGGGS